MFLNEKSCVILRSDYLDEGGSWWKNFMILLLSAQARRG